MANAQQLEIIIKTVAQTAGIAVTEQEVKKLTETLKQAEKETKAVDNSADALAKQFGEANRKAQEFGNSLKGLSEDQMAKVRDRLREQIQEQQLAGRSADELRQKLADTYGPRTKEQIDAMSGSLGKASTATDNLSKAKQNLGRAAQQTSTAMSGLQRASVGLSQGGFAGLVNVVGGLTTALRSVGRFAGPVGIAITGVAGVLALLSKRAKEAREEMEKLTKEGEANAAKYAKELEKLSVATTKQAEAQKQQLADLSAGYQRLATDIEKATQSADAAANRRKELELAAARNPEERAQVENKFAALELENRELRATAAKTVAEREQTDLRGRRDSARLGVSEREQEAATKSAFAEEATKEAEAARAELEDLQEKYNAFVQEQANGFTIDTEEFARVKAALPSAEKRAKESAQGAFDLQAKAEAAKADAEEARKNLRELEANLNAELEAAQARIDAAAQALEDVATARVAQAISVANQAATATAADLAAIKDLEKQRKAAADSNDPAAFRKAEQAIAEKQRAIAGRSSTLAAGDSARAANNLPPANGRTPAPAREAGTITRGDDTVTVRVGGDQPAQTGGVIRRNGEVVSDTRQLASTLEKASAAQQDRDRVIIKFAEDTTKSAENTKRQVLNSREKSQP